MSLMQYPGKFITFEGGEGCGKSTQLRKISALLKDAGIPIHVTREPGGTELAEKIRDVLVTGRVDKMDVHCEYLMFSAARRDHLEQVIKPTLAKGTWVLCDRFFDSSLVYQGYVQGLDRAFMKTVYQEIAGDGFVPDATYVLDLDPEVGLERALREHGTESRFEKKGLSFHQQVRQSFLDIAVNDPDRVCVIDARQTLECVTDQIMLDLEQRFSIRDFAVNELEVKS